ncbi:DUF4291 domain-containing protein [Streptomyces sp. NBC_01476]|uniref:DUF4291 domain-containing protein n=1 Tax=Streptomyces sp. NBC_01476 TaxID=2903881 RepID=UPI002E315D47|nr:DUF4291 domain-containing protein [Streptomyces sp. NBC_01476]
MPAAPREIRALYSAETITVYQAYSPQVADPAAARGRFPDGYDRGRMTWIKPSFLWMMYRSSWASAVGQERVLAIRIRRDGFAWALAHSALSSYDGRVHTSRDQWKREMRRSPVRIQWDPERDLNLQPLQGRSLQIGLSGEAVHRYVDEWVVGIDDVTELARTINELAREGLREQASRLLPAERPYPLPGPLASRIGASRAQPHPGDERTTPRTNT